MYYGGGDEIDGCFEKNLGLLKKRDPILAERLANLDLESQWKIESTKDRLKTVKKSVGDGNSIYIHSRVSPKKEAKKWVASIPTNEGTLVVLGFGLGYHLLALQRRYHHNSLVIIEADLELFQFAMKLANLTPILKHPKVHLFIGESISAIEDFFNNLFPGSIEYQEFLPSTSLHSEYYQSIKDILGDYIYKYRLQKYPLLSQGIMRLLEETKR